MGLSLEFYSYHCLLGSCCWRVDRHEHAHQGDVLGISGIVGGCQRQTPRYASRDVARAWLTAMPSEHNDRPLHVSTACRASALAVSGGLYWRGRSRRSFRGTRLGGGHLVASPCLRPPAGAGAAMEMMHVRPRHLRHLAALYALDGLHPCLHGLRRCHGNTVEERQSTTYTPAGPPIDDTSGCCRWLSAFLVLTSRSTGILGLAAKVFSQDQAKHALWFLDGSLCARLGP